MTENNKSERTYGAGLWLFGQFVDRYAADGYGPAVDTLGAIARAGEVDELTALDINYPFGNEVTTAQVKAALAEHNLKAHAITPHVYMRRHVKGAFTNPDPDVRKDVIELYEQGVDIAQELGAKYVKCWPGQDGYDYPFQADYQELWELSVKGVREVAEAAPNTQFAIEYKFKEPRTHMTFANAATTLLAIQDMGVDNVGLVVDLGHSFFAKETPADILQLAHRRSKLVSVEVNDNWRDWDDDMSVGSVHLLETLEFMLTLRKIGWNEVILLDQFPFREDPVEAARASIRTLKRLEKLLDRLDVEALKAAQRSQNALAAQEIVLDLLLS